MSKEELVNAILVELEALDMEAGNKGGSMFLSADIETESVNVCLKGNMQTLAMGFGNLMRTNEGFNRVMLSFFGGYLANHPEEKQMFIAGLEMSNFNMGAN